MQFQPDTKQERLASLQAGKPQQASSRTRGAALQMPASEVLCLYISPEVIEASLCGQLGAQQLLCAACHAASILSGISKTQHGRRALPVRGCCSTECSCRQARVLV